MNGLAAKRRENVLRFFAGDFEVRLGTDPPGRPRLVHRMNRCELAQRRAGRAKERTLPPRRFLKGQQSLIRRRQIPVPADTRAGP